MGERDENTLPSNSGMERRRFLGVLGSTSLFGIAGCLSDGDDGEGDTPTETDTTDADDATDTTGATDTTDADDGQNGEPSLTILNVELSESELILGELVDVSVTVANDGDGTGDGAVELRLDGDVLAEEAISLDPSDSRTVAFDDVDATEYGGGTHELLLTVGDDEETVTVTLEDRFGSDPRVLLNSTTDSFRHDNIEEGNARIEQMGQELLAAYPWETEADEITFEVVDEDLPAEGLDHSAGFPEDATQLEPYDVVVFNSSQGNPFNADQREALREYVENGGSWAGIHNPTNVHTDWEWYTEMVGAVFDGHPSPQDAVLEVRDGDHPSTRHLDSEWERYDEWYDWQEIPSPEDVDILIEIDHSTYSGTKHSDLEYHPSAWSNEAGEHRMWYTALGHTAESWEEEDFVTHVRNGIAWAAGWMEEGDPTWE